MQALCILTFKSCLFGVVPHLFGSVEKGGCCLADAGVYFVIEWQVAVEPRMQNLPSFDGVVVQYESWLINLTLFHPSMYAMD